MSKYHSPLLQFIVTDLPRSQQGPRAYQNPHRGSARGRSHTVIKFILTNFGLHKTRQACTMSNRVDEMPPSVNEKKIDGPPNGKHVKATTKVRMAAECSDDTAGAFKELKIADTQAVLWRQPPPTTELDCWLWTKKNHFTDLVMMLKRVTFASYCYRD